VRVRQAIALAIDRQALINTTLKGVASPALGDESPLSWAYNPALKAPARDINAAKSLLTAAGWVQGPDGYFSKNNRRLSFNLVTTAGNKQREEVAKLIAGQLKEAGIELVLYPVDVPVFFGDVLKNRRFETAMYAWVAGVDPDNASLWNSRNIPSRSNDFEGQNYPGWRNPEVDKLTDQGARTVDLEARRQIYFRIQELIMQEVPVIPLYFRSNIDAVRDVVVNYKPNPTPSGNLWNAWEWGMTKKR
jgi:peptide/nickel transport system substrate-binding protein